MRSALFFQRVTATVTAASLLLANGFVPPAAAQPAPPPGAQPAPAPGPNQANPNQPNPPGRVGRLAVVNGTVSFHGAEADHWDPATLNFPVTSGDSFWTEPGAQAEIEVAGNRMMLAEQTELDVNVLDDHSFQSTEPQGEVYLNLTAVAQGESYTVKTPRGMVTLTQGGRYDIAAGDVDHPTLVTVIEGAAQVSDDGLSLQVGPDQTATITGTDTFQGTVGASVRDAFLIETMQAEQPPPPPPQGGVAPPAVVSQMTGCAQLARYGTWRSTTAPSGIRRPIPALSRTATAAGPMCSPGAGPGWMRRPGVSRRSITDAGWRRAAAGAGRRCCRASRLSPRSTRPPW